MSKSIINTKAKSISKNKKSVHFISLGCPKNLVDTEIMLGSLSQEGYQVVDDPSEAETIIINTCGFIDDAKKESIEKIMDMTEYKKTGKLKHLVAAGCLTQRYKDELVESLPEVDLFVGSGEFQKINSIIKSREAGSKEKRYFNLPTYLQEETTPRLNSQAKHMAYLKISEGCKKRCAFCAIPLIRGNLQSRTIKGVVSEAKLLAASGVRELIVISHDFTDYGWDLKRKDPEAKESPYELLKALADDSGAQWIRLLYLYPDGVTPELVELIKTRSNLVKYFDMPLQHINDRMLKLMNRRMTRAEVETAIDTIRTEIPDAVIRTQFIVGFPGETEEQFNEVIDFIKAQKFDRVGCFKYSPEEGTKGATLPDPVDEDTKERRYQKLMTVQRKISREKHKQMIGRTVEVLIEGYSDETELLLKGRTSQQAPEIDGLIYINDGVAELGDIHKVEITDSHDYDLVGKIVSKKISPKANLKAGNKRLVTPDVGRALDL
jgi:ribosomal protein S12 methylthiotransferase